MNRTTYQVEMSTDGTHKVTVTIEDPGGTDAALAWAKATHAKLMRSQDVADEGSGEELSELDPPECGIHHKPMERMIGRKGPFWSCHEKNADGSWCNYRAPGQR